ncbi:MAG: pyridoxamine 5'-phosphate oxidase family protein [Thermoguttaceae bacterium]
MNPTVLDVQTTKSRILALLEKTPVISFGTCGPNEWPNVRALLVAAYDGVETLWIATSVASTKVAELKSNPKAVIYGYNCEAMQDFRLFGNVDLLSDSASRKKIWRDDFIKYFPEGIDSPDMIVLRFNTDHGTYNCYARETGTF